jgi:hypothetical protein
MTLARRRAARRAADSATEGAGEALIWLDAILLMIWEM